jgi:hypothetical protein
MVYGIAGLRVKPGNCNSTVANFSGFALVDVCFLDLRNEKAINLESF